MAGEIEDLNSREAQTVCDGLERYEDTLRGAVRDIHVDIQLFKQGIGRQVEEVLRLASPLAHAVSELQQENRRLRVQLERLSRQVEALGRSAGLPQEWVNEAAESPQVAGPGSPVQGSADGAFSGHAKLRVAGRSQSVDLDDHRKPEFRRVFSSSIIENGHRSSSSGQAKVTHELTCFEMSESSSPEAHAPAVTLQMPHLPVTAVTRTSEKFSGENIYPAGTTNTSSCLLGQGKSANTTGVKSSNQPVKDWNSITMRTMDSSASGENATSVTKPVSTVNYGLRGAKTGESAIDSYCEVTPSPHSPPPTAHRQVERRRELVRSQTLPRTTATQARKALFEKLEHDGGKGKGESRAKLKRSLSFGVASASSIKQILLDWCRSKTIGYKHIDLQNFSSSWNDGMAFCALVHSFFPEAFDYNKLDPANRKQNFELAFTTAEKMAHCDRLIEVEDMMVMGHKPDPMCVFTYVQSLYSHLRCFE
ncbi:smoothelin-like protein 2 isoform X1 [Passer domesticus]|uniref:smoothelin-like protein 2 isoform X1 n=1 Tax=Passer domesticus TaxID=48849 RepID=UPI0030FE5583